jgi:hypothetical protein
MNMGKLTNYVPVIGPFYALIAHTAVPLPKNSANAVLEMRQHTLQSIGLVNAITHLFFAVVFVLPTAIYSVTACALFGSIAVFSATQGFLCYRMGNSLSFSIIRIPNQSEQEALLGLKFINNRTEGL